MPHQEGARRGGHWSPSNPIPTITKFFQSLDERRRSRTHREGMQVRPEEEEEEADEGRKIEKGKDEQGPQEQLSSSSQQQKAPGQGDAEEEDKEHTRMQVRTVGRKVVDPTTGREVEIDDVNKSFMDSVRNPTLNVPNANLDKETPVATKPEQPFDEYKRNQDITAPPDPIAEGTTTDVPIHGEKTNVLFHPTPSITYAGMFKTIEKQARVICACTFLGVLICGKMTGGSLKGLIAIATVVASVEWLWMMDLVQKGRNAEWTNEKLRGETAIANLLPESVEWINSFMVIFWGIMNPEMFSGIADTIEDVMQLSLPPMVENIHVAQIDQGSNPIRLLSIRALPDDHHLDRASRDNRDEKKSQDPENVDVSADAGDYYNVECSFAYHAMPSGSSSSSKAANMHMLLVFYLGIKGFFGIPFPVFVELIEIIGTVRLRVQVTPEPPYVQDVTISLMGLPHIRAGCTPMLRQGVNIMNLPLISDFVNHAISAATNMYVAPKSMSIDLRQMLQGDDTEKETNAIGIMWIRVHRAVGLSKQDARGSYGGGSDPYINLSFFKYGKPMYCTRVIVDDLNPVWEESAAFLVSPEQIRADEQLSVELWDSDRSTADDVVGKIELSMQKIIQQPGKMFSITSKLRGTNADTEMPGTLEWEAGFFSKPHFRKAMRCDGQDPNIPKALKDVPAFQVKMEGTDYDERDAVMHTPPDPLWPTGIVNIVIHNIVNLEMEEIKGSFRKRQSKQYDPAKKSGENIEEQGKHLPTSYCTLLLNDELVYRTRSKAVTSKPIFNTATERFLRDWRSAIITVAVRDKRFRQHDPIIGLVHLKLSEILETSSQRTRWYPLIGGIGFGHIRISLLFRSVETRLPPQLLGWGIGTFSFVSHTIKTTGLSQASKMKIWTSGHSFTIHRSSGEHTSGSSNDTGLSFGVPIENDQPAIHIPINYRYRSAIVLEAHGHYAILWLQDYGDNHNVDVDIPLWKTKNGRRLTQNYITEDNYERKKSPGLEDLKIVGRVKFTFRFNPGLSECHRSNVHDNNSRETLETWDASISEGIRPRQVSGELPESVRHLHERSLIIERDIIRQASVDAQRNFVREDGVDLSKLPQEDKDNLSEIQRRSNSSASHIHDHLPDTQTHPEESEKQREDSGYNSESMKSSSKTLLNDGDSDTESTVTAGSANKFQSPEEEQHARKRTERRKHRGLMQWAPARSASFAKDEAEFALKRVKRKVAGGLTGREPDVETEAG